MNKLFSLFTLFSISIYQLTAQNCPNFGDLIITEIMQNPASVTDAQGEYFEIYNRTQQSISLQNLTLRDEGVNTHLITDSIFILPQSYFVLGRNADTLTNGGVVVDYVYENFFLENGSDQIIIECNEQLIDRVDYDNGATFPDPTGASLNLNPEFMDAIANDRGENWCISTTRINENGDFGTPQRSNAECPIEPCTFTEVELITAGCVENDLQISVEFVVNSGSSFYEMVNLTNGLVMATGTQSPLSATVSRYSAVGDFSIQIRDALNPDCATEPLTFSTERCTPPRDCPNEGDLVITEIRQNPRLVSDDRGEYFELYNPTDQPINLQDMQIRDADRESHFIIENIRIAPNQYFTLSNNVDSLTNGGIPMDYEYQTFTLANTMDEIILQCNNTIIDSVGYDDGMTFPDPNGASMELEVNFLNAIDNDNGENWVISDCQPDSTLEAGTPQRAMDDCLTVTLTTTSATSNIHIFPNPTTGNLFIKNIPDPKAKCLLMNVNGKAIQYTKLTNPFLDLSPYPAGLYFLQIQTEQVTQTFRLLLQKE